MVSFIKRSSFELLIKTLILMRKTFERRSFNFFSVALKRKERKKTRSSCASKDSCFLRFSAFHLRWSTLVYQYLCFIKILCVRCSATFCVCLPWSDSNSRMLIRYFDIRLNMIKRHWTHTSDKLFHMSKTQNSRCHLSSLLNIWVHVFCFPHLRTQTLTR